MATKKPKTKTLAEIFGSTPTNEPDWRPEPASGQVPERYVIRYGEILAYPGETYPPRPGEATYGTWDKALCELEWIGQVAN